MHSFFWRPGLFHCHCVQLLCRVHCKTDISTDVAVGDATVEYDDNTVAAGQLLLDSAGDIFDAVDFAVGAINGDVILEPFVHVFLWYYYNLLILWLVL